MPPGTFFMPLSGKVEALLETHLISDKAKVLMVWLLAHAEPRDGHVRDLTQAELASRLSWSRPSVAQALTSLHDAGMIAMDFPRGTRSGWVQILAYYDVMQPTKWLSRQRAMGRA